MLYFLQQETKEFQGEKLQKKWKEKEKFNFGGKGGKNGLALLDMYKRM